jgi:uncharacterized protein YhaN
VIIWRVRLRPFGFFADREVAFGEGLNVVLGPNEAGKSTLFNAIKTVFIRSRLSRKIRRAHALPSAGAGTARRWKSSRSA